LGDHIIHFSDDLLGTVNDPIDEHTPAPLNEPFGIASALDEFSIHFSSILKRIRRF
jgi:hypothetical protein